VSCHGCGDLPFVRKIMMEAWFLLAVPL